MTNDERKAQFEEQKEQLILLLLVYWAEAKYLFWSRVPHRHIFETRAVCTRCWRSMADLFR